MNHVERFYHEHMIKPHIMNAVKIAVYKSVSLIEKDWTRVIHFNRQPNPEQESTATRIASAFLWVIGCLSKEHPIIKL